MKRSINLLMIAGITSFLLSCVYGKRPVTIDTERDIYKIAFKNIDGVETNLSAYKGKKILIVNVASECGHTPQYADLQKLSEKYKGKLVIIGFPCNQFLGQEPGNEEQIKGFCTKNYGVTFPLASKIEVKGKSQHPLYQWLTQKELNGVENTEVTWNFQKYLIDEKGNYVKTFTPKTSPLSEDISTAIEK